MTVADIEFSCSLTEVCVVVSLFVASCTIRHLVYKDILV